jgi:hypothetical protein
LPSRTIKFAVPAVEGIRAEAAKSEHLRAGITPSYLPNMRALMTESRLI